MAQAGRYCDGNGLYLQVDPSGARRWVQRLVIRGTPRTLGVGGCAVVSLAEARDIALGNRKLARAGGDPLAERRHARGMPTFEEAAAKVLALHRPGWRNAKHAAQWATTLQEYAHPHLGSLPVSEVTTADVLTVLTAIWHDKPETARRVRQRIGAVMKWAVAKGYRQDNPAGDALAQALPRHTVVRRHLRALPHGEVAGAIQAVRASRASAPVKLAFEFLVLTAARSGEVRLATWDEMDLDAAVWLVPGARMKAKRDHRVPLSGRALAILRDAQSLGDGAGLVFPSPRGKPFSDMALSKLIKELGFPAVPHGFRSSFRDWAAEQTNTPREVVEAALAHTVRNPTEAAYARSDLFARRRRPDGRLGLCHRGDLTHSIAIAYRCICNRFPSSYPSFAIRCPKVLKTACGRLEIVDRRDDHALISAAGYHRHDCRCHRTTIARRQATRTRGRRTEAQESRTAAQDVPVLPLACGPARRLALSRTRPWTMLAQRKHSSYSGSGGGAGSRSAQKSIFPNTLGKPKRQSREKRSRAEVQVQNRYSDSTSY